MAGKTCVFRELFIIYDFLFTIYRPMYFSPPPAHCFVERVLTASARWSGTGT
jgi:hypothetical protein